MSKHRNNTHKTALAVVIGLGVSVSQVQANTAPTPVQPASMPRTGTISERFLSYNVEMLEVTGGKFWKPYASAAEPVQAHAQKVSDTPTGMNASLYAYRDPIDLSNPRLRKLAAALAPAYVRTSGTWANTTYFADSPTAPTTPPAGFKGVLTQQQWKGLIDFSNAVDAPIVTSFATGPGVRDSAGNWNPQQAQELLTYTEQAGGHIAAAEFMNEPNFAAMGGAPANYDAAAYGRDFKIFHAFVRKTAPNLLILGPGSVGESDDKDSLLSDKIPAIKTPDLLTAAGPGVDAFSYHHYGAVSQRCAPMAQTTPQAALSEGWLSKTDKTLAFYRKERDKFEPGKAFWLTETADAACGGNPWASTFLDTFRYMDQLGRLAKQNVQVVAHNTLVASDYGLLDEKTLDPKPNYWGAWLWRQFMGTTVLESGIPNKAGLHVYAQCLRGTPGGVSLLVLNTDITAKQSLKVPMKGQRFTLDATAGLDSREVALNGAQLKLGEHDALPPLNAAPTAAGVVEFEPASITFLNLPEAKNQACL